MTSNYVTRPVRDLCKCGRGPVNPEYETCEHCYLDAQANIVDWIADDSDDNTESVMGLEIKEARKKRDRTAGHIVDLDFERLMETKR